jgi:hypothetical protein
MAGGNPSFEYKYKKDGCTDWEWVGNRAVTLPTDGSSGSILIGENALKLAGSGGATLDTYILTRTAERSRFAGLREEEEIVEHLLSKDGDLSIEDFRMDDGLLRRAKEGESRSVRLNRTGEPLRLRLLTSALPPTYRIVAEAVRAQWRSVGIDVSVEILESKETFEDRVIRRDYDVLLFGQPLLDNLDSYPYWHSSQIQARGEGREEGEEEKGAWKLDANNLSQYASFKADTLLTRIRETHDEKTREKALEDLRALFREDVPAVVLYSPTYVFAVSEKIFGVDLGKPSLHSDRFLSMHRWFIKQGRGFKAGQSWWSFPSWLRSKGSHPLEH